MNCETFTIAQALCRPVKDNDYGFSGRILRATPPSIVRGLLSYKGFIEFKAFHSGQDSYRGSLVIDRDEVDNGANFFDAANNIMIGTGLEEV